MRRPTLALPCLAVLVLATPAFADGTLYMGTDTEEFNSVLPDRLARYATIGASIGAGVIIPLDYPLNGMANAGGFLYAGDALSSTLRRIDYDGNLLSAIAAGFDAGCCNEDMVVAGANLYHAHFSTNIQLIEAATGMVLTTFPQADVVGMARVGTEIWISKWAPRQVGRWDPLTNVFTPVFSTPTNAGGLAYDPEDDVLWVGREGGWVEPYDLAGNLLGPGFQPFGDIPDTVDGLELVCQPTVTEASASPSVLWPPNHKLVEVTISYAAQDCAAGTCVLTVSSNEPIDDGGDGHTMPDWEVVDGTHVRLRAERSGALTGRIYTITVTCTDLLGQTSETAVTVTVPHDQGP